MKFSRNLPKIVINLYMKHLNFARITRMLIRKQCLLTKILTLKTSHTETQY